MLKQERIEWMERNMKECPINHTFKLVGKKFTMLIIRNMIHHDHKRFNQFLEIEDINAKVLSVRLKEMEEDGLIERKIYPDKPVRIEYTITEKGRALEPILNQMSAFSMRYCAKDIFKDGKARKPEQVYGYEYTKIGA
ncbi:MAG TPA: helix-turn-helix domain-containing protein [Nitrososphaeraceae archaeon]|nr:helix-turn-helix domain-containing protein [Nitrososphaeraceae archaeon]